MVLQFRVKSSRNAKVLNARNERLLPELNPV